MWLLKCLKMILYVVSHWTLYTILCFLIKGHVLYINFPPFGDHISCFFHMNGPNSSNISTYIYSFLMEINCLQLLYLSACRYFIFFAQTEIICFWLFPAFCTPLREHDKGNVSRAVCQYFSDILNVIRESGVQQNNTNTWYIFLPWRSF